MTLHALACLTRDRPCQSIHVNLCLARRTTRAGLSHRGAGKRQRTQRRHYSLPTGTLRRGPQHSHPAEPHPMQGAGGLRSDRRPCGGQIFLQDSSANFDRPLRLAPFRGVKSSQQLPQRARGLAQAQRVGLSGALCIRQDSSASSHKKKISAAPPGRALARSLETRPAPRPPGGPPKGGPLPSGAASASRRKSRATPLENR
jgi:hypothetical protein